jgi:DNA-binding response OmpR family regulator
MYREIDMTRRILIIEDDPTAIRLTEYTLKQRGYTVLTTYNGLEGLITAQKEEPDLIILDVMLPGIDGYELCKRLRAGSQTAQIPILILSAKTRQEDISTGFRAGANDYLAKPASPAEIISRVENLLSESAVKQSKTIAFVSSSKNPGTTTILSNLATAIAERDKKVVLIDIVSGQSTDVRKDEADIPATGAVILETESANGESPEPDYETLPSGIRILHIEEDDGHDNEKSAKQVEIIQKMGLVNDYLLIDVPFKVSDLNRSILSHSSLCIIVSDYRITQIADVYSIATSLKFLGVTPDKIATILVDTEGKHSSTSLLSGKPYLEANLGITVAGVISLDVNMYRLSYLDSQSIISASPNSQLVRDINTIAQFILTYRNAEPVSLRTAPGKSHPEKKP